MAEILERLRLMNTSQQPASDSPPLTSFLSIAIFKGQPLDYQHWRHVALVFRQPEDSPPRPIVIHIVGGSGFFELQHHDAYEPREDKDFLQEVEVGSLLKGRGYMLKAMLVTLLRRVPIENRDIEFNCQTWVQKALVRLRDEGFVSAEECEEGVCKMVEATLEGARELG